MHLKEPLIYSIENKKNRIVLCKQNVFWNNYIYKNNFHKKLWLIHIWIGTSALDQSVVSRSGNQFFKKF